MTTRRKLREPTVKIDRDWTVRINGDTNARFRNELTERDVMRTIETDRFTVRFLAETCSDLDLSWLVTKARVEGGRLVIEESSRYTSKTVDKYGSEKVIQWINGDREHMAEVIRSYVGLSDEVAVFDARIQVVHNESGAVLGERTLGQCIYDSYEDFCQGGGYASDLVSEAISEARDALHDLLAPPSHKVA